MKRIVLTFGLIAGVILSSMMVVSLLFWGDIGYDRAMVVGYTTMVLSFLLIYFGVRSYRDTVAGGTVSFGRAFAVGWLIAAVASVCYSATWQVFGTRLEPDFMEKYQAHVIEKARAEGKSEAALAEQRAKLERDAAMYANPVIMAAFTFMEPQPVALIVALVSAGILSRRRKREVSDGVRRPDGAMADAGASA
jgi:hypothetical protein